MVKKAQYIITAAAVLILFAGAGASDADAIGIKGTVVICLAAGVMLAAAEICRAVKNGEEKTE